MDAPPLDELAERLGIDPADPELIRQAFVHSSFYNENPTAVSGHNERLEFYGDAVIGLTVSRLLYDRYPDEDEGFLTARRAALVNRDALADAGPRDRPGPIPSPRPRRVRGRRRDATIRPGRRLRGAGRGAVAERGPRPHRAGAGVAVRAAPGGAGRDRGAAEVGQVAAPGVDAAPSRHEAGLPAGRHDRPAARAALQRRRRPRRPEPGHRVRVEPPASGGAGRRGRAGRAPRRVDPGAMSRLKELRLHGFKSFADPTRFVFEPGVNAVIGPNGSGKSNMADAVRWVLGEQSNRSLRTRRADDVIFAGSEQRRPQGMAEAILTLDNGDGWLPIDFAEVSVGRRAYRSGDSEYLINGARARLRDVVELLGEGRLGANELVVVGQGTVDAALSLRPEERRQLFEEAAGVKGLQVRRNEASVRLTKSRDNLTRVSDLIAELKPQVRRLALQAEHQQQHDALGARARALVMTSHRRRERAARAALGEARRAAAAAESALAAFRETQDAGRAAVQAAEERYWAAEEAAREAGRAREATREAVIRAEGRLEALEGRLRELAAALERETAELAEAQRELDSTDDEAVAEVAPALRRAARGRGGLARGRRRARGGRRGAARRRGGGGRAPRPRERPDRRRGARVGGGGPAPGPVRGGQRGTRAAGRGGRRGARASRTRPRGRAGGRRSARDRRDARRWRGRRRSATPRRPPPMPRARRPSRSPSGCGRRAPSSPRPRSRTTPRRGSAVAWWRPAGRACSTRSTPRRRHGRRSRQSSAASSRARCCGPATTRAASSARPAARPGCWPGRRPTATTAAARRSRRSAPSGRWPSGPDPATRAPLAFRRTAVARDVGALLDGWQRLPPGWSAVTAEGDLADARGVIVLRGRADPPGGASARAHARRRELTAAVGRMEDEAPDRPGRARTTPPSACAPLATRTSAPARPPTRPMPRCAACAPRLSRPRTPWPAWPSG